MTHSWMSDSDYGGEEKNTRPKEHLNYGEKNQNMKGDPGTESSLRDELKQKVTAALDQDPDVSTENITVTIKDNFCVELSGTVPDPAMIKFAEIIVHGLGIDEIENRLVSPGKKKPPLTRGPFL